MSDSNKILERIAENLVDLKGAEVVQNVREALNAGSTPREIIQNGLSRGMETVGTRYENGEYFLSELIMAATIMNEGMEIIRPHLGGESLTETGKVVIGTIEGDLHDIGKNIVSAMLESAGFEVIDLGVDVPPSMFVEEIMKKKPDILCMSTLLSVTMPKLKETIERLIDSGLRREVKVLVGGRCLNNDIASEIGADAFGKDAWDAVNKAKDLMRKIE